MEAPMDGIDRPYDICETPVLEPLRLPELPTLSPESSSYQELSKSPVPCVLCEYKATSDLERDDYLTHLLESHRLVIADINLIANFKSYCLYWKERFKQQPFKDICSNIKTTELKQGDDGYYLLSDVHPEDKELRDFLQKRKLEFVLISQQREREDTSFCRDCLFCREHFTGNRSAMLNHMAKDHAFSIGQPDNLVFTDEFLDVLQEKLNSLQCLYCEKTFRDKDVLKEHMRKKQHRKINPKNTIYDKFYVINYLELGKNWEKIHQERDIIEIDTEDTESEDEWAGWEEESGGQAVCLFCSFSSSNADKLQLHMQELHDFDLQDMKLSLRLTYYQQVKLVNFIRRQVHLGVCIGNIHLFSPLLQVHLGVCIGNIHLFSPLLQVHLGVCIGCGGKFDSRPALLDHMHEAEHSSLIPETSIWDQPQYFFPTYENDNLLCQLDADEDDVTGHHDYEHVIAEDTPTLDTILREESLQREILQS
ncbi:zinc finger protein 277-like isoform X2 [Dreissena polymorpha]|uniref:zinc finger protein 277-like isoform X2 n=1 Tax=Dreissena polymorpha TaxID=45954 RepID=UPI0022642197|nr:zinc finger protein 277-like isoform X2 [Dreissena polymorpha]